LPYNFPDRLLFNGIKCGEPLREEKGAREKGMRQKGQKGYPLKPLLSLHFVTSLTLKIIGEQIT
jgi:hypothetical protein